MASKLSAVVAATEAAAGKAIKAAKSNTATRVEPPVPATAEAPPATTPEPTSADPEAPATDTSATSARVPKDGPRWSRRTGPSAGKADRHPKDRTRPVSTSTGPDKSRHLLPRVGRRDTSKPGSVTDAKGGGPATDSGHRRVFSRPASGAAAGAAKARSQKPAKARTPATPQERRRRIPVALAAVFAVAVLATSFPLSSLLSQHRQLAAAGAQLDQVQKSNRALTEQEHALDSNVAVSQLARGDYQMVSPGQTLYDVLPASSSKTDGTGKSGVTSTTSPGSTINGDPGNQPLVAPANAPDLNPEVAQSQPIPITAAGSSGGATTSAASTSSPTASPPAAPTTFWGRVSDTLQFWN